MINQLLLPQQSTHKVFWCGFYGDSLAIALYQAALKSPGLLLYIAEDNLFASQLAEQLQFFNKEQSLSIQILSDCETLPYDNFSPHPDITSARLALLARLASLQRGIIIVAVSTLLLFISLLEVSAGDD